jgi:hypothetical protein
VREMKSVCERKRDAQGECMRVLSRKLGEISKTIKKEADNK